MRVINSKAVNGAWNNSKTKYTYWAEVVSGTGSRNYQNAQTQLTNSYTFKIRYNSSLDINAKWLVVYEGKQYTVTSITRDKEKNFYWNLQANG